MSNDKYVVNTLNESGTAELTATGTDSTGIPTDWEIGSVLKAWNGTSLVVYMLFLNSTTHKKYWQVI